MDPSYEFIAPQFVDFTSMDPDGDGDEDKFFDVKNETAEEEVLGYLTARDGELTEGAMEEEQEDEQEVEEEVDIIEAQGRILFPKIEFFFKSLFGGVEFFMVRNGNFGPNLVVFEQKIRVF